MILIGLYGGGPRTRETIARQLVESNPANVANYALHPTSAMDGVSRAEKLNVVLKGAGAQVKSRQSLVITHVLTLEEADAIRARGGHLWYVLGEPSEVIPIALGDIGVTARAGGCGNYRDPIEALSEVLLALGRIR